MIIFTGLTAYDTQKIKNLLLSVGGADDEMGLRISLLGSLTLYLDFVNLFLYLLRFFGPSPLIFRAFVPMRINKLKGFRPLREPSTQA